jgi:hypothetical protein
MTNLATLIIEDAIFFEEKYTRPRIIRTMKKFVATKNLLISM